MIWQSSWQSGGGDRKSFVRKESRKTVTACLPTSARVRGGKGNRHKQGRSPAAGAFGDGQSRFPL